jgi:hypothetical protein
MMKLMRIFLIITFFVSSITITGCTSVGEFFGSKDSVTLFGAKPLLNEPTLEKIDLAKLLDPKGPGMYEIDYDSAKDKVSGEELKKYKTKEGTKIQVNREVLQNAYRNFYNYNDGHVKRRRNSIQEQILIASNQRCGIYKNQLKTIDARANFALGFATTLSAGLGAIFTAADTVRALSGSAAILSGTRAEFNEVYFSKQTIQVLTEAMEVKRRLIYEKIKKSQIRNVDDYTVEAAIKDAVTYHTKCSLIAGLEQAAISVQREENPGIKGSQRALIEAKKLQHIMNTDPGKMSTIDISGPFDRSGASDMQAMNELDLESPITVLTDRINKTFLLRKSFEAEVREINSLLTDKSVHPFETYQMKDAKGNNVKVLEELKTQVKEVIKAEEMTKEVLKVSFENQTAKVDVKLRKLQLDWAWASTDSEKKSNYALLQSQAHSSQAISYEISSTYDRYSVRLRKAIDLLKDAAAEPEKDPSINFGSVTEIIGEILPFTLKQRVKYAKGLVEPLNATEQAELIVKIKAENIPTAAGGVIIVENKEDILKELGKVKSNDDLEPFVTAFKNGIGKDI